ncbi:hypothetical protein COY62_03930 [bacterium (Candidatus Howlettbacteria) CG_4_10_14_0_8_um_filter_40_9]|nr:MAG: hypothetical protein COY62_03930 [bacterium (Candidatus Howlettbacteria) CG_4_10_14_0_8_um_filter_40_9]
MKLASEIINTDVFSVKEQGVLGKVKNIVIDPASGNFVALQIYGKGMRKDRCLISSLEIKHLEGDILIVDSEDAVETKEDLPKPYEILKSKISILGSKVFDEAGIFLGRVFDFALDSNIDQMTRIYVTRKGILGFLGSTLIISYIQIVEVNKNRVIVSSGVLENGGEASLETMS